MEKEESLFESLMNSEFQKIGKKRSKLLNRMRFEIIRDRIEYLLRDDIKKYDDIKVILNGEEVDTIKSNRIN